MLTAPQAAYGSDSGFLSDYSKLKPVAGTDIRIYRNPDALARFKDYRAIMIDQPELIIASDSKYKGIKPDEAKAVADIMRQRMNKAIGEYIEVVDKPGPGVLYLRIAASNIHLKKKKRGLLGYTPAGFVVTSAAQAAQDMQQKIILEDLRLEMEVMDSQSQEVLAAVVDVFEAAEKSSAPESWSGAPSKWPPASA
jgi:hypothetical protein